MIYSAVLIQVDLSHLRKMAVELLGGAANHSAETIAAGSKKKKEQNVLLKCAAK